MEVKKLFTETFNEQLIQSLPMKDAIFSASLASRGLFPGDLKEEVNEQGTEAQRARLFIERTAKTGKTDSFQKLLAAMEKYGSALKDLAQEIRSKIPSSSSTPAQNTGQYFQPPAQVPGQVPYQANVPAPGQYYQLQAPGQVPGQYYQPPPGQYDQAPGPGGYPPNYQYTPSPGGLGGYPPNYQYTPSPGGLEQSKKRERTPSESDSADKNPKKESSCYADAKPKSTSSTKPPPNESTKSKPTSSSAKPHGTAALAGATSNQNDDDDEGTEKIINSDNGSGVVSDTMMTEIKGAVCLIRGSQDTGTGFIGRMELNGEFTFVLMTNNHIFGDEKTAKGSSIEFQFLPHQPIYLSELIEEGQFFWTNTTEELDFSIVKINGEKLEEKLRKKDKSIIPINLCAPASIKTGDYIRIIQHPHGGELSMSMSTCKVLDALLLYESGTHPGSSGSPVLKEINGMLVIVALHRGGREVGPNKDIKIGYNYATLFSEIQNCVSGKDYKKKPKVKKIQEFLDECESK